MDLARKIQTVLLPREPFISDYDVSANMVAASTVGGDYYDVFRVRDRDWILVGDVSGHGVTAGLCMMIIQTAVRTVLQSSALAESSLSPKEVLCRVNAAVRSNLQKIGEDQYMTIMALEIDGNRIRYSGLHQDILVYRASSGTVERIESRGIWIGLLDDIDGLLDDDVFEMSEGDVLVLYTDGITEARVGRERLGTERLASAFRSLGQERAGSGRVVEGILDLVRTAPFEDDVTVLAARYLPSLRTGARESERAAGAGSAEAKLSPRPAV
jgi:serine phosphatase RsbU (regulator of sigma subunit)